MIMTDESSIYPSIGKDFAGHGTVNHSADEYVRMGGYYHVNTAESRFALFKRGVYGTFHSLSEAHLDRYLAEFDFRANTLALSDKDRCAALLTATKGRRLLYENPHSTTHA
jgi:hypothetical protein